MKRPLLFLLAFALGPAIGGCSDDSPATTTTEATGSTSAIGSTTAVIDTTGGVTSEPTTTIDSSVPMTTTDSSTDAPTSGSSGESTGAAPVCGDGVVGGDEACDDAGESAACNADCTVAVCGDAQLNAAAGEECDDGNDVDTDNCVAGCKNATCGDGFVFPDNEGCDDGNQVDDDACSNTCALASCGDKIVQMGEDCDDGNADDTDACLQTCVKASCGDGAIQAGVETCDDSGESLTCDLDCTAAMCGDGVINMTAKETCDDKVESKLCDTDCTAATCGDSKVNMTAGEACDDGNMVDTDACVMGCKAAKCGDGFVQANVEACDDGNMVDNDACTNACKLNQNLSCQAGAVEKSVSPGGTMKVCDHPNNTVCEQDQETLCPVNWHLCSLKEFNNRNANWNYAVGSNNPNPVVVGEIYCRPNNSGAGHITLGPYGINNLGTDSTFNCGYGSSRPNSCPANYGCNELFVEALCCSPNPKCGNGAVDDVEEECDDGNNVETDDCLNSCTWRLPSAHGIGGC
ncbi:MAG: DUF4215 domain-containing protein [Nannocystis sp.]|uniref:DUF4215 domain-containing protein n=1 Tax=Nannocystis sp. TaxID=1962667 RepID=UPI002424AF9A|nr:DUF4215 domain-containing protein [Nannocystis sp.]MBK9754008.1 DUF4215 domain-containing protein [Nannocystis sp.]